MISTITNSLLPMLAEGGSWLDKLLGLSRLHVLDGHTILGWRWPVPLWLWVVIFLAAGAVGVWSYRYLLGARWARVLLGLLRTAVIIVIVALLAGPMLVLPRDHVEPDWLIMLVDRSASMQIKDMRPHAPNANDTNNTTHATTQPATTQSAESPAQSRDEVLRDTLRRKQFLFGDQQLGKTKHILWLGFDAGAYPLAGPTDLGPAKGQSTALRTAIQQALQRAAGHPISALVVMSDGQTPQSTGQDLVHELKQQAVSVISVPLGSDKGAFDLAVSQVQAPDKAFLNDPVPVSVWLEKYPPDQKLPPGQLTLQLSDAMTGQMLQEKTLDPLALEPGNQPVHLTGKSATAGPTRWRAKLVYTPSVRGPKGQDLAEQMTQNNQRDFDIELVDRQLKVLYVEGYPRWDYRYLKNMLLREKSVLSSVLLLSADRGFVQEGTLPITRFPRNTKELEPYDVIIIGDVPAGYFGTDELQLIQDHVATTGAGLLWIGGQRNTPRSYAGTPLAALLPMLHPSAVSRINPGFGPLTITPTPLAQSLQVLELDDAADVGNMPTDGSVWRTVLAPLWWVQDVGQLKPTAEVLAKAQISQNDDNSMTGTPGATSGGWPSVLRLRFGAGQSLYVATDDTWRWRFGRGDVYFERFWTQLVRMLARGRLQQDQGQVSLTLSSPRVAVDEPVVVTLRIKDPLLARQATAGLSVNVSTADDKTGEVLDTIDLQPVTSTTGDTTPRETSGGTSGGGVFQATWRPRTSGRLMLKLSSPTLAGLGVSRAIEVTRPDDEMRQPAPDIARLVALAKDTGGHVLPLDQLSDLATLAPNRAKRTPDDIRESLGHSSLALTLVILLLTLEWIGRKMIRLT